MLGFQGKALQFLFFFFSFSPFFFRRRIGLLSIGVLNLLKAVNETRIGCFKVKEVAQFFSLSLKPNVLGVWLAKGGRKRVERNKSSTCYPLIQAWNQSNINRIRQCFNFSNYRLGKTRKIFGRKMGPNFEKSKL